ncbi:glycosyltransferase [Parabacteroides sp. BX2]|jgi:glycosyltransferase involved in cell wall biosynthesis|uniref:Glycosyltransferase n=1 Tax=Parabacteroides segnis TaxID=2763058 RepID=A0ABR7DYQ6_9BACT|nr:MULTISPECIES: glycosyltransferase [Parabacteroides]MBC5642646.1 glycosyltransferase [Parabacteroides segnis]MCM0711602.1 glycosyltransferase [Parabacteroides sp. TA-V-105]
MKKCVFLVTGLEQGGIETYLLRFLKYNNKRSYNIIWCKSGKAGALYNDYKDVSDEIILKPLGYFSIFAYIRFYLYLKKNNIDTICDFNGHFAGLSLVFGYFARVKKRITFYRGSTNHFKETKLRLLYNYLMKILVMLFATKILANSKTALDFFYPNRKDTNRFQVVYNDLGREYCSQMNIDVVSIRTMLSLPLNAFVIGHVGRYNIAKNHETILKVAEILCKKYADVYFVLVGKDTDIYLKNKVLQMGLSKQIQILGYRSDVSSLLKSFDLFYFPSITEGQPNALIEAMANGIPVIASNIDPIKESVPLYLYDKLLSPNDVNKTIECICKYYFNRDLLNELVCQNWVIDNFCSNKWFDKFEKELL